jgi:hypothetical protein
LIASVEFRLDEGIHCTEVALSFTTIYCYYVSEKRMAVQMINFINEEIPLKEIDLQSIGLKYKVQYDCPEYAVFTYIHRSRTAIAIIKVFKNINQYKINLLTAADFGVSSLYIENYFALYKTDEETLVIFLVNTITNTLNLFRGKLELKEFVQTKLKTVNDSISLGEVSKFIWRIDCRNQM